MKITALETLRLGEFANLIWVRLHTDEGLVGLGETFMGAAGGRGLPARDVAPKLLGTRSARDRGDRTARSTNYLGWRASGVETRGNSAVDIALWDLFGKAHGLPVADVLGGRARDRIRVYNTCAGYKYIRDARAQSVANWHVGETGGPYEDLEGFLHRADEVALSLLEQGITGMKIWPFDIAAERSGGWDITPQELKTALEPFEKIRRAVGDRMDIMVEFHSLWSLPMAKKLARALEPFDTYWHEDPFRLDTLADLAEYATAQQGLGLRVARRWRTCTPSASTWRPARPASSCSTCRGAADSPRRARSPAWPRPGTRRSRRTTAPDRSSTRRPATSRCTRATR